MRSKKLLAVGIASLGLFMFLSCSRCPAFSDSLCSDSGYCINCRHDSVEIYKKYKGVITGEYLIYEDNDLILRGYYLSGKKEKVWKYYNHRGQVFLTQVYKHDFLLKQTRFNTRW